MKRNLTLILLLFTCILSAQVTLIPTGSTWKYLDNGTNQGSAWYGTAFNDGSWSSGNAELGYGDGDEATVIGYGGNASAKYITSYFRKTFNVANAGLYNGYTLKLRRDDGIVVYVNGTEVYRSNMPGGAITYTTLASSAASDDGATVLTAVIPASVIVTGTNVVSAEVHQNAANSSDLTFELELVGTTILVPVTVPLFGFGAPWKYLDNGTDQGSAWYGTAFNDVSWASGNAEFGYGDGDETTVIGYGGNAAAKYPTSYFRKTFTVSSVSSFTAYTLSLKRDDGVIVYVNGTEVYRENMPSSGVNYTTYASANCADDGGNIWTATLPASVIVTGTNVIAAEIHQTNASSSDLTFDLGLTAVTNSLALPTPTIIKGPYLVVGTPTSMVVRWETNIATDSKVMYSTNSASLNSTAINTISSVIHSVQITGLTPYTKYFYNIGSTSVTIQGDTNNYFVTNPVPGTPGKYRFWVVGDCGNASTNQVNCKNQFKNYNGNRIVNAMLLSGDNAYNSGTDGEYNTRFFGIYQNDMLKKMTMYSAPGNHDYNNGASTATTVPYFTHFQTPTNGESGGVASNNPAYYSYDYGNVHFLSLDSYGTVASQKMYDTTGAQTQWIKQDLAANTKKWVIAYWHHPPYTMGSHNSDTEGDLVNIHTRFIKILERYGVDMIITGHSHDYERSKLMNGHYGNEASFNALTHNLSSSSGKYDGSFDSCPYTKDSVVNKIGTVYVVSGSAGQLGGQQASFPHNAKYYSNATNGGTFILDIEDNKLEAKWLCADGNIRDQFAMFKDVKTKNTYTIQPAETKTFTASWPGTYSWGDGSTQRTLTASAISDTTIWVKDPNNCVADTFKLKVLPAVDFTIAAPPYCVASAINFSDLSTNNTTTWSWSVNPSTGVTFSSAIKNPGLTFTNPGTYTVSLRADNAHGMGAVVSKTITVLSIPTVSASLSATAICVNQSATLTAGGSASSYTWDSGSSAPIVPVSPLTSTSYTLTGMDLNGCQATNTISLQVNTLPTVSVVSNPVNAAVCNGSTLALSGAGANTYNWTGGITNGVGFTVTTGATYTVTGTDGNNCQNTAIINVTANALPQLTVSATPGTAIVCAGNTLVLTASGANIYSWTGLATNAAPFIPPASGLYTVTGTDNNGCKNTLTQSVTVNALPQLTINATPLSATVCNGSTLSLMATGAGTLNWSGAITNGVPFMPVSNLVYSVTGTDVNGCQNTLTKSVTVHSLPQLTVNTNPVNAAVCNGSTLALTASGAATLTWSGSLTNTTPFVPTSSAVYTVTGTDLNGCQSSLTQSVTVNTLPQLTINASPAGATVCNGSTLALTATGAAALNWSGTVTNAVSFTPSASGLYTVTGTDNNGCQNILTQSVVVNALPLVSISGNTAVCLGGTLNLSAAGATSYSWNTNVTSTVITVSPSTNTVYSVTGTDANGCKDTKTKSVTVNSNPTVNISGNMVLCAGETTTITAVGAPTFSWSNSTAGTQLIIAPKAGYNYMVTGIDANGCKATASTNFTINPLPGLNATTSNTLICAGESATLTVSGASTYTWNGSTPGTSIIITPAINTTYNVSGVNTNNCLASTSIVQNVSGCTGIEDQATGAVVSVYPNPNKGIFNIELNAQGNFNAHVFNALGERVYSAKLEAGPNGVRLSVNKGIYFYVIFDGIKAVETGKLIVE